MTHVPGHDGGWDRWGGERGLARTDAGGCVLCGGDVAPQVGGKIVVPGAQFSFPLLFPTCVARFNADGSIDTGFGSGGLARSSHMGQGERLVLQADGKILVASRDFAITRFDSTGAVDQTWGEGGTVPAPRSTDARLSPPATSPCSQTARSWCSAMCRGTTKDCRPRWWSSG
jgi:Domain of unknown function (DUF5122) beta-propeller